MPKPRAPSRLLKKLPRGCGPARARQADRSGHDRVVVCRRGPDRAEEQDHPALGQARLATLGAARSTHRLNLYLRRHLPQGRQGAGLVLPRCNIAAMNLHLAEIAIAVAPGAHAALVLDQAGWRLSDK